MTERQFTLLRFIAEFQAERRFAPSLTEMMTALGVKSRGCVHDMIKRLMADGLVWKRSRVARGVELTEKGLAALGNTASLSRTDLTGLSNGDLAVLMMRAKIEFERRVDVIVAGAPR